MATSGTTTFDLDIDDIIEEAYERCAVRTNSGRDLKSARRSLNILFSEWGNRGVHLWKVALHTQALTAGTATYTAPSNTSDILEAYISSSSAITSTTSDVSLTKISRSDYASKNNKGAQGQPSEYYVDRQTTPTITLYQTPDASTYTHLKFYCVKRIEDANLNFSLLKSSLLNFCINNLLLGPNIPKTQYSSVTSFTSISSDKCFFIWNLSLSLVAAELIILK